MQLGATRDILNGVSFVDPRHAWVVGNGRHDTAGPACVSLSVAPSTAVSKE
jgi:hypothetical protein